jgi:predicted enzyme related to lactoylglutathione lyase
MALNNNAFCWYGIVSKDAEAAKAFYAATIGWECMEHTFPNGETATMFAAADFPRVHLRAPEKNEACRWSSYLRVKDVDASTASCLANGGGVIMLPADIAPGRMSVVTAPSGALLCLFHEADEEAAMNAPAGEGSIHWTELHSNDADADVAWLKATFGFEIEEMTHPGGTYYMLNSGGKPRGGVTKSLNATVVGRWLNWVHVGDVDATLIRAADAGGQAITEASDYPGVGRMAIVRDPTGAVFGVIAPVAGQDA